MAEIEEFPTEAEDPPENTQEMLATNQENPEEIQPAPKKRGRPVGAKNKPKPLAAKPKAKPKAKAAPPYDSAARKIYKRDCTHQTRVLPFSTGAAPGAVASSPTATAGEKAKGSPATSPSHS